MSVQAHLVQEGFLKEVRVMESILGITHHFSMRRGHPERFDDLLKITGSWAKVGLEPVSVVTSHRSSLC